MTRISALNLELPETLDYAAGQVLLVDKPKGWTSFDAVNKIRGALKKLTGDKKLKVGHAGTLDPLATGLLIIATGKMTKRIDEFQIQEKEYEVEFALGGVTKTYDSEFAPEDLRDATWVTEDKLKQAMHKFTSQIEQMPPAYSALKIEGKRAYELARQDKPVELKPRSVDIKKFELLEFQNGRSNETETKNPGGYENLPIARALVVCSKGTYIRSLIHDLGQELGCGAYIRELRRTRIGQFELKQEL